MDFSHFFTKRKILALILIGILITFCYIIAIRGLRDIYDSLTPRSSGNTQALFYVENPESGSVTCIGDGLINSTEEISNNEAAAESMVVTAPDYSAIVGKNLVIVWNTIRNVDDTFRVYGTLMSSRDRASAKDFESFPTFADLKAANVTVGTKVKTKGYFEENDGGAATYIIKEAPEGPVDGIFTVELNNGLFACLQLDEDGSLNIVLLGVRDGDSIGATLNNFLKKNKYEFSVLQFNSGNYYIEDTLFLRSLYYKGTGNTNLIVDDKYRSTSANYEQCIRNSGLDSRNEYTIDSINFYFYSSRDHMLAGQACALVGLTSMKSCTINNCKFVTEPHDADFCSPCTLLWFKNSTNNVKITNTTFINHSATPSNSTESSKRVSGCLYFQGNNTSTPSENILIDNCHFFTTTIDELICLWNGVYTNCEIRNCDLTASLFQNNNMLCTNKGTFNNFYVHDTTFNCESDVVLCHKIQDLYGKSDFNFDNVTFNLKNGSQNPYNVTHYMHYISYQRTSEAGQSVYNINNCHYNFSNDTKYYSAVGLYKIDGITVNMTNTTIPKGFIGGRSVGFQSPTFTVNAL